MEPNILLLLTMLTAIVVVFLAMPSVINIAKQKKLVDLPNDRSSHTEVTPRLGGIAIMGGFLLASLTWGYEYLGANLHFIIAAVILLFSVGLKDDLVSIAPLNKLFGQLMAASLVLLAGVQLTTLHGVMGITTLSPWFSIPFSLFVMVVIINSFNLIDGINGLSSSITLLVSSLLGTWFYYVGEMGYAIIAFSLAGSMIGFLRFNLTPAKVFMGDCGSLIAGLIVSVLTIHFIESHINPAISADYKFNGVPAIAVSLLIFPLFDTLRVFTMRILKGRSPLSPDRNHIHHLLIDAGFTHLQATGIIVATTMAFILMATTLQNIGALPLLGLMLTICIASTYGLKHLVKKRKISSVAKMATIKKASKKKNGRVVKGKHNIKPIKRATVEEFI